MNTFKNNSVSIEMGAYWEKLSPEKQLQYIEKVIYKWQAALPFYQIENQHTMTKRHGPFLVSITFLQSNYGYIPSFSIQSLLSYTDVRYKPFNKQLQSPDYFVREDYFNDIFSGFLSYFSIDETFDEAFALFKNQVPLAFKKDYTLSEIHRWFEYCIQEVNGTSQLFYMLDHILLLRYFEHDELMMKKYAEYLPTIEKYYNELAEESVSDELESERQTFDYWQKIAFADLADLTYAIDYQLCTFPINRPYDIASFTELTDFPLLSKEITQSTPYLSLKERQAERKSNLPQEEIKNKEAWSKQYLFFNNFEKQSGKPFLRTMFREHLNELLESYINNEEYHFDLEIDGHILITLEETSCTATFIHKDEENVELKKEYAHYEKEEYIKLLESGVNTYLNTYFCLRSEKNHLQSLIEEIKNL